MGLQQDVIEDFGDEWQHFDQSELAEDELLKIFNDYFVNFPWRELPEQAVGFDAGCGSGRWAKFVAQRVNTLHCIDASEQALMVAKRNTQEHSNCIFHHERLDQNLAIEDASQDFGYSLGVLHHIEETERALRNCVRKLKPGAPFMLYLYYHFDNKPSWYRKLWRVSNSMRQKISKLPKKLKRLVCDVLAGTIYWPLARFAKLCKTIGFNYRSMPLAYYHDQPFYVMRNDALDRFGTKLEKRYTKAEIDYLMKVAGLERISFNENEPYWVALGYKR